MNPNPELDPKLDALLQELRRSTPRDPELVTQARQSFLAEAAQIAPKVSRVSISTPSRLNRWKEILQTIWFGTQKEQKPMFNIFMTVLLVLGAVFGTGMTTAAAAQHAQPGETLYPLKTWTEDVRTGWENDPQAKLDLALQFSARRAEEMQALFAADNSVPEPVVARFENQQQQALGLAAGLPDGQIIPALERIRDLARQQEQALARLHLQEQAALQSRARVQNMLQIQEQVAGQGIQDPDWLRQQLRQHGRDRNWLFTPTAGVTETMQTPLSGNIPGATGTSTPCSSYGPGPGGSRNPWTTGTPTPGSGNGAGESQNPWTVGTPTPGSGYGPGAGTGDCSNCTPQPRNENPTQQPGSGTGGGSGSGGGGGGSAQPAPSQLPGAGGSGNRP